MITQLFKPDFLATECCQINLNILRAASRRMTPKGRLMVIRRPYSAGLDKKTDNACKNRFDPKTLSSFILLNSYDAIIIADLNGSSWAMDAQSLYVAASRAKHLLAICAHSDAKLFL